MTKTATIRASVHTSGVVEALINPNPKPNDGPALVSEAPTEQTNKPFHVAVITSVANSEPRVIVDSRICDLYNFQSRKWLTNHQYWAMHQGHTVEIHPATTDEVTAYTSKQAQLLSRRYSH